MPTLLILMVCGCLAVWWWSAARAAAERARSLGRRACETAGVQWLDDSVHAAGLRLRRRDDGWLGLERRFVFDYSEDGHDRHRGQLVLLGNRLVAFSGPRRAAPIIPLN